MNSSLILISLFIGCVYSDFNENEVILLNRIELLEKKLEQISDSIKPTNLCKRGWFAYLDQKCFKVIEEKVTEEEAESACSSLDGQASLLAIHSQQELDFLSNQLIKYNNISDNVWIGLKYTNNSFKWLDNTDSDYNNWSDDALRDGSMPCVQMSITKSSLGKWSDNTCNRKALIVCQKKQSKSSEQTSLPIGFIYTQLPNQSSPIELWPQTVWTEVTEEYSGLFFRAEGGNAGSFGETQQQSYSRISNVSYVTAAKAQYNGFNQWTDVPIPEGKWSGFIDDGNESVLRGLRIFTTYDENRPINTAIKIWKRIQ